MIVALLMLLVLAFFVICMIGGIMDNIKDKTNL